MTLAPLAGSAYPKYKARKVVARPSGLGALPRLGELSGCRRAGQVVLDVLGADSKDAEAPRLESLLTLPVGERHVGLEVNRTVDFDHELPG